MKFKDFARAYDPEALEKSETESVIVDLNGLSAGAGADLVPFRRVEGGVAGVGVLLKSFRTADRPLLRSMQVPVRVLIRDS